MVFRGGHSAFTLIELLVVIAIIAILAVVVILTLNPAQLLAQSRDANRVSDLATINSAINLYSTDQGGTSGYSLGTSTIYLSIPSASSSCATLGMASSAYPYACSTSANYRVASSSGWLPINFNQISSGAPFGSVPVDPTNQTSSNLYYTYVTNGSTYEVTAFPESQKYAKNAFNGGGNDPALLEAGSGATTLPDAGRGLVGYWPLNEGTGITSTDWSGTINNNGTWQGTPTGTSGFYSPGKTGAWAGAFDGVTNYVDMLNSSNAYNFPNTTFTVTAWIKTTASGWIVAKGANSGGWGVFTNGTAGIEMFMKDPLNGQFAQFSNATNVADGNWHFIVAIITTNTTVASAEAAVFYIDGALNEGASVPDAVAYGTTTIDLTIGQRSGSGRYAGLINDVRIYDRALSPSEILEMYNAEK